MNDLNTIMAGMPPGANLFDYLSAYVDEQVRCLHLLGSFLSYATVTDYKWQVYPDLGRAFYVQCHTCVMKVLLTPQLAVF
jgi:hypothetical protein